MNILERIVTDKLDYLENQKAKICEKEIMKSAMNASPLLSFKKAIGIEGLSIVGEIKKASPSKGVIDSEFNYMKIAREYNGCVDAISVLTETIHFLGDPSYLEQIAQTVDIPVLRKDFIIDSYQIFESRVLGASCVLLITSILDSRKLKAFIQLCTALGMDCLVEVHNETELYRALRAGAEIIGINNRNLEDFTVDIRKTGMLRTMIPEDVLCIGESGIKSLSDAAYMKTIGVDGILVGEYFMRSSSKQVLSEALKNA